MRDHITWIILSKSIGSEGTSSAGLSFCFEHFYGALDVCMGECGFGLHVACMRQVVTGVPSCRKQGYPQSNIVRSVEGGEVVWAWSGGNE